MRDKFVLLVDVTGHQMIVRVSDIFRVEDHNSYRMITFKDRTERQLTSKIEDIWKQIVNP